MINVFTASGNIGNDMEVRVTPNGKAIGSFSLPVKQGYGDHEKTSWVKCVILGDRASKLSGYLTKGSLVTVTGEFYMEEWESQGRKNKQACLLVNSVQLPQKQTQKQEQKGQAQAQQAPAYDLDVPFAPIGKQYRALLTAM